MRDLENENTKQMIVSIRKNILGSSITQQQQGEIEETYKTIMKKLKRMKKK